MDNAATFENIDEYIALFPAPVQKLLQSVRSTIRKAAPDAEECISYQIPTFKWNGNLVHFAGYKSHIGFYPGAGGIAQFKSEIEGYKNAKGSVQFPIDQPLPLDLISRITKFRVQQNVEKALLKKEPKANTKKDFMESLSKPAQRALQNEGIATLKQLSKYSVTEIVKLHGMGAASIPKLKEALEAEGLVFRET
jgi:uncharacterized protein YdhG (YjbR/CyaY superfamily)